MIEEQKTNPFLELESNTHGHLCYMCNKYGDNQGKMPDNCRVNPRWDIDEGSLAPQRCIDNGDFNPNQVHVYDEVGEAEPLREEALKILQNDDPLEYMINTIKTFHMGDEQAARLLILSIIVQNVKNARGYHPAMHGESGKGKTALTKSVKHIIPQDMILETSLSSKYLFYKGLKKGIVVLCDDINLDDEIRYTLKRSTTNFDEPTQHCTLNKQVPVEYYLPSRMIWWLTSIKSDDDDQILNREIPCDVDDSTETDNDVWRHQCDMLRTGQLTFPETNEVMICRAMFKIIKDKLYIVYAPFATEDRIEWRNKNNRRNFDVFADLLKSVTLLYRFKRKTNVDLDGQTYVEATEEDFYKAANIYGLIGESNATKLTKAELQILRFIASRPVDEKYAMATLDEISQGVNKSHTWTWELLHGKNKSGGLLKKVPALIYEPETEHIDEEGSELDRFGQPIIIKKRSKPRNKYILNLKKYNTFDSYANVVSIKKLHAGVE